MTEHNAYSAPELMTINAARLLRDGDVVFVGVGLPNLACNLARRTQAPNLVMIYEAGVIGAQPARLPLSIGDPTLVSGALAVCSMYDIFAFYLQRGNVDVGFLGGRRSIGMAISMPPSSEITLTPKCACPALAVRWKLPHGLTGATLSLRIRSAAFLKRWISARQQAS